LYLSRPSATAPLYRPATVAEVGEKLAEAGDTLGGLLDLVTKFGGIVQLALRVSNVAKIEERAGVIGISRDPCSEFGFRGLPV